MIIDKVFLLRTIRNVLVCFVIILDASLVTAQTNNIDTENQQWFQYYNQVKVAQRWNWLTDIGYRWKDSFSKKSQHLVRSGIGYQPNQTTQILQGFAHLGSYSDQRLTKIEFRPYQEILIKNKYNKLALKQRIRIEERFFHPITTGSNTFNFRFRYALCTTIPLIKFSSIHPDKKIVLHIGDEIFVNAGNQTTNAVFDQNRIMISPTLVLNKKLSLSLTWNSQFLSTSTPAIFDQNDVVWFQVKQQFDLTSK